MQMRCIKRWRIHHVDVSLERDHGSPTKVVTLWAPTDSENRDPAAETGAEFVELHTGSYAEAFHDGSAQARELGRLVSASEQAHGLGLRVNAGHGLNYENLRSFLTVPHLVELNIGHSIVSRAMQVGIGVAVRQMLDLMKSNPLGGKEELKS